MKTHGEDSLQVDRRLDDGFDPRYGAVCRIRQDRLHVQGPVVRGETNKTA